MGSTKAISGREPPNAETGGVTAIEAGEPARATRASVAREAITTTRAIAATQGEAPSGSQARLKAALRPHAAASTGCAMVVALALIAPVILAEAAELATALIAGLAVITGPVVSVLIRPDGIVRPRRDVADLRPPDPEPAVDAAQGGTLPADSARIETPIV